MHQRVSVSHHLVNTSLLLYQFSPAFTCAHIMSTGSGPPHCMLFGVYVVGFVLFGLVGLGCFYWVGVFLCFHFLGEGCVTIISFVK